MSWLLLFSLGLNIFSTIGMIIYSWLLWQYKAPKAIDGFEIGDRVTAPWTWSLKFWAVMIRGIQIGFSVFYINGINTFQATFPRETIVISYVLGGLVSTLLFFFVADSYYALRRRFNYYELR